jgi:predicted HicB family RNase H-like nuclease
MAGRTNTEEGSPMEPTKPSGVKTLGIRLPDELHAQFSLVAQLDELSLTDALRRAVELYVERKKQEGDFATRASAKLEEIEREAAARRDAIQALFGQEAQAADTAKASGRRRSGEANG